MQLIHLAVYKLYLGGGGRTKEEMVPLPVKITGSEHEAYKPYGLPATSMKMKWILRMAKRTWILKDIREPLSVVGLEPTHSLDFQLYVIVNFLNV